MWDRLLPVLWAASLFLFIGFEQSAFHQLFPFFVFSFGVYIFACWSKPSGRRLTFWLLVALVLRVILLPYLPNLSDDFYRFIWDGHLVLQGINPLDRLPVDWMALPADQRPKGLTEALFKELNSQEYFTVYPPVNQLVFSFSVWCFPKTVWAAVAVMKTVFLLAEVGSVFLIFRLLERWKRPTHQVLWYALNPLILFESFHNLHFEILMIFFLLAGLWLLVRERFFLSGMLMALSVATKLLPLMFFPFLLRRLWFRKFGLWSLGAILLLSITFIPFLAGTIHNLGDSLGLYFQHFEYNGGLYYVSRWIGIQFSGYNLIRFIGPGLALAAGLAILILAFRERSVALSSLPGMWLWAFFFFLLSTTTLHPWYLSLLIAMSALSGVRFPLVWSFLILMTYVNYSYPEFQENLYVVAGEYVVLFGFIFLNGEWRMEDGESL
ncbi:MAG: glycosyltransferase 87 family protein [Bacteroidota bacterium]